MSKKSEQEEKTHVVDSTDELSSFLTAYEKGPDRAFFKTAPPATLLSTLSKFTIAESVGFVVLIALTLFVRVYKLGYPDSVVFDEVHFGGFASKYTKGEYLVDVHPPLVKLVYYAVAKYFGYKGDFDFSKIGTRYLDSKGEPLVPYVPMRLFSALCGVGTVLFTYKTAKVSGCRPIVCFFGALICCFENSLLTQSRYVLLDAPLIFFISAVTFSYKAFEVSVPLSRTWYRYLCLLGFSLALAISSKWVGFFTFAFIGLLTLKDLWFLVGDLNVTKSQFARQFGSRFYFLIITPIVFYLGIFALHFMLLPRVGDGTSHMSPQFQSTLENSVIHDYYSDVLYGSTVSIRHVGTGGYLHSHQGNYPKTGEQQVTLYGFQDTNNDWLIEKRVKTQPEELFETVKAIPNLQKVRFFHQNEKRYLRVNDQRPPMSEQDYNNEVTLIGNATYAGDGNNEVFEIKMLSKRSNLHPGSEFEVKAVDSVFQLYHVGTGCYLYSHDVKLPKWGFGQLEVMCIEKPTLENSLWYFEKNTHPMLEKDEQAKRLEFPNLTFWDKVKEVHKVMVRINNGLTESHTFASQPATWPFLTRGVNYWGEDHKNVYFLGNIATYWLIVVVVVAFATFIGIKATAVLRPSFFSAPATPVDPRTAKYIHSVTQFALGWFLHYIPSFLMDRQLFLHHYLPSVYFGILVITQTFEFITAKNRTIGYLLMMTTLTVILLVFWKYSPLVYGLEWTVKDCMQSKVFKTWDINCINYRQTK